MIRCSDCKQLKDPDQFWKRSSRSERRNSVCKVCISLYRYRLRRKNKLRIIDVLGGKCAKCGYTSESGVSLSIDHRNPQGKGISVRNICSWTWRRIETELETGDCWLLCMNCHNELEYRRNNGAMCRRQEKLAPIEIAEGEVKFCPSCENSLPLSFFSLRGDKKRYSEAGKRNGHCKECSRQIGYRVRAEKKQRVVVHLGGKCATCGHTSETGASLSVDHRNPDGKGRNAANLYLWSWPRILAELEVGECWLLCVNCHNETEDQRREKTAKYGR